MADKKKSSKLKEYIQTTALYEFISVGLKFLKNHHAVLSIIIIMIFAVGIATYPIVDKMFNGSDTANQTTANPPTNLLEQQIYVTVTGEVVNPGIYQATTDDRINDVIQKAGGFTENAYTENINLARKLTDGQYINIISKEYAETLENNKNTEANTEFYGIVNINTATVEELCKLPGIGESTALKIIEYRELSGGFEYIEDIQNVSGIGPAKFEKIKYNITV